MAADSPGAPGRNTFAGVITRLAGAAMIGRRLAQPSNISAHHILSQDGEHATQTESPDKRLGSLLEAGEPGPGRTRGAARPPGCRTAETNHLLGLESELVYAGQGYCMGLAMIATPEAADAIRAYLDRWLPEHDCRYAQDWAIAALMEIDRSNGTTRAAEYLSGAWASWNAASLTPARCPPDELQPFRYARITSGEVLRWVHVMYRRRSRLADIRPACAGWLLSWQLVCLRRAAEM